MKRSIRKNYLYNLMYQLSAVLLSLITMPYVSRVLEVEGIGINSYTNANTQYFILIGSLGISIYATKKIATVREDIAKLRENFWGIFLLQFIGCILAYIVFLLTMVRNNDLSQFYFYQGFFIIASAVDISWYFLGKEDFKNASIRSLLVKVISVLLIFMFVRTKYDLWKYIFINSSTILIGQLVMWIYVDKTVLRIKELRRVKIIVHILPALTLFLPQVATQVYMVLDKTMTGILTNTVEVGYYDQSQKIIRVLLAVVTSLGMVMLPRIANMHKNGQLDQSINYLRRAFRMICFLSIPISFGIIGVSNKFIPLFFGANYTSVIILTQISALMIIIIGVGNVFGTQYLLAIGKNKEYTYSVCVGAVVNLSLNLILIPKLAALGAVIATLIAETFIASIQCWYSRKILSIQWIKETYKYWIAGILMLIVVKLLGSGNSRSIVILTKQVLGGVITYFVILFIFRDSFLVETIKNFKMKVFKKEEF